MLRQLGSFRNLRHTFKWHLTLVLFVPLITSVLAIGVGASWIASSLYISNEIEQGKQISANFSQSSAVALRYHATEQARESVVRQLAFPGVVYAAIHDAGGRLIIGDGALPGGWHPAPQRLSLTSSVLANEDDLYWHFIAPIFAPPTSVPEFFPVAATGEYIGYVHLVRSKISATRSQQALVLHLLLLVFLSVILASLVFTWMMRRLVRPIQEFAGRLGDSVRQLSPITRSENSIEEFERIEKAVLHILEQRNKREEKLRRREHALEVEVRLATEHISRARDEAEAANRHKSEFLATVSHELRTPLHIIIGYTESAILELSRLGEGNLVAELDRVMQAASDLLRQINNLLDFERMGKGAMPVAAQTVDLAALGHDLVDTMGTIAQRNKNRISLEIVGDAPIVTDEEMLRRILMNLLSNACKFTSEGEIKLSIHRGPSEALLSVSDTGIGIDPTDHEAVFEAFRQVGKQFDRPHGTGLGLAIVRRFCELLGGTVNLQSAIGRGSTFVVRLPVAPSQSS